jgi:hypothetical protein
MEKLNSKKWKVKNILQEENTMKKKNLKTSIKNITEEAAADHHLNQVNTTKK